MDASREPTSGHEQRRRYLDELDAELGPVDESLIEHFDAVFAEVDAANRSA